MDEIIGFYQIEGFQNGYWEVDDDLHKKWTNMISNIDMKQYRGRKESKF